MATLAIPALSVSKGWLTNNSDRAAYLLTFWIYNPGGVSDYYESYNGSLRNLASKYQQDPHGLAGAAQAELSRIFERNFPGIPLSINVDVKEIDGYKYGLTVNIMSAPVNTDNYKPIILFRSIEIDDDYRITLKPYA